jgi:hypothetical protein
MLICAPKLLISKGHALPCPLSVVRIAKHPCSQSSRNQSIMERLQPQAPSHPIPNPRLKLSPPLPPHLGRLHIGRTLIIRLRQHAHNRDEYLLHTLYRAPPLGSALIVIRIIARRVEDRNAYLATRINCSKCVSRQPVRKRSTKPFLGATRVCRHTIRMPNLPQKLHLRWAQRIILRKLELGGKYPTLKGSVFRALYECFPGEDVVFGDGAGGYAVGRRGG